MEDKHLRSEKKLEDKKNGEIILNWNKGTPETHATELNKKEKKKKNKISSQHPP